MKALIPVAPDTRLADLRPDLAEAADEFANASLSQATRDALKFDWAVFSEWCAAQGFQAMPASADTAAGFVADQANTKKVATLVRYRASISKLHKLRGHPSPFNDERVKAVIEGIRRKKGVAQERKAPMTLDRVPEVGEGLRAVRDHAILLLGIATSFRGKELCSLDVDDLKHVDEGFLVTLRRSKTDQRGEGREVGVPRVEDESICPVQAVEHWLEVLGVPSGPLFRGLLRNGQPSERRLTRQTVALIVKSAAESLGFKSGDFASHSLRAGFVTEARNSGQTWESIMAQTGHKRLETVKRYARGTTDPFKESKVADIFTAAKTRRKEARNKK